MSCPGLMHRLASKESNPIGLWSHLYRSVYEKGCSAAQVAASAHDDMHDCTRVRDYTDNNMRTVFYLTDQFQHLFKNRKTNNTKAILARFWLHPLYRIKKEPDL